ncbi:MAG TPA: carboxymuconolactone decarboxylase family protein [Solirubrobacteraceae bacterium]
MENPETPRIAALEPPYKPETEEMLRRWMPPGADMEPLVLFRTLAVHPELMSRMRPLGSGILGHGSVPPRDREIVVHRACARAGAEYEWGVHAVAFGAAVGLTPEQIAATATGEATATGATGAATATSAPGAPGDPAWSDHDAALIRLADELHDTCTISDELWGRLSATYGDEQLLELLVIAGWYRAIAYVINAARIPLEPWAARFPDL